MDPNGAIDHILARLKKELAPVYTYHNADHTVSVITACEELCVKEGISGLMLAMMKVAAAFHDAGFLIHHSDHELHSAEIAAQVLPVHGFSEKETGFIQRIILATRHGHQPMDIYEQIIRDADVDYLGTKEYERISSLLRQEFMALGVLPEGDAEWHALQVSYLQKHRYHTQTARKEREPQKQKTLTLLLRQNT